MSADESATPSGNGTPIPPSPEYAVTVEGEGLNFKRSVPQAVALQIIAVAFGGAAQVPSPPPGGGTPQYTPAPPPAPPLGDGPKQTVGEFIHAVEAKRNPDKIAAIAAYLKNARGVERFSRDDIKKEFPNAGEAVPGNFPRDFSWALGAKWVAADAAAGKDQYYITGTGLKAVGAKFSSDVKQASRQKSTGRRRTTRKKSDDA